jgi:hypothetical protein
MIGIWNDYVNIYLYILAVAVLIGFGLPLLFVPIQWARVFRWEIPESTHLAAFLGRTVGALLCVISVFAYKAAINPTVQPFFVDMILWIICASILIHAYGAIKRVQPITETIEIIVWVILLLVTLAVYPT